MKVFILLCFSVNLINCENVLAQNIEEELASVAANLSSEFIKNVKSRLNDEDDEPCVMRVFDEHNIVRLYLRGFNDHMKNRTEKYDEDVEESIDAFVNAAKVICIPKIKLDQDFDELFNETSLPEVSNHDKCVQKYFIDEKLIDASDFNLNISGVNTSYCEEIVSEIKENISMFEDAEESTNTFFGLSATKAHECSSQKFKAGRVMERIFLFQIIGSFGEVNDEKKEVLRSKYIETRTSSVRFLLDCIKEI